MLLWSSSPSSPPFPRKLLRDPFSSRSHSLMAVKKLKKPVFLSSPQQDLQCHKPVNSSLSIGYLRDFYWTPFSFFCRMELNHHLFIFNYLSFAYFASPPSETAPWRGLPSMPFGVEKITAQTETPPTVARRLVAARCSSVDLHLCSAACVRRDLYRLKTTIQTGSIRPLGPAEVKVVAFVWRWRCLNVIGRVVI